MNYKSIFTGIFFFGFFILAYLLYDNINSSKELKQANEQAISKIDSLQKVNRSKDKKIKADSLKMAEVLKDIEGLKLADSTNINKIKTIAYEYNKLQNDYDNANAVQRDSILSRLLSN